MDDLGVFRACEKEELFALVAADVAQDAAVFVFFEKPIRPGWGTQAVGAGAEGLHHLADGPGGDQLAGAHSAFDMQSLGKVNGVFPSRRFAGAARLGELLECCEGRFVGEVILPRLHDPAPERATLIRHGGGGNESHLGVLENFLERACRPRAGKLLDECGHPFWNGIIDPFDDSPGLDQSVALSIDVPVVEVGRRDYKFPGLANRRGFAHGGVCHSIG